MTAHSRLAPSSAYRWRRCPLSVSLGEAYPEFTEDPSGPEGTAAHWVWLSMLESHKPEVGELAPNGVAVTDEMIEGALQFVDKVFKIANPHGGLSIAKLEERLTMSGIHPLMFGTPDAVVNLLEFTGELHIIDYKFGHRSVDPFQNDQLAAYAFGEFERGGYTDRQIDDAKVFFHIVQPRCFHNRPESMTWETPGYNLRPQWQEMRESAAEAILHEQAAAPRAGSWCVHCPGRRACPTLRTNAGVLLDAVNRSYPAEMPPAALGLELEFVERGMELLEAWRSALRAQVEYSIGEGEPVPGWAMTRGKPGSLAWLPDVDVDDVIAIANECGAELTKTQMAVTPTQAIAALKKKGFDDSVILAYSERKPGALKLTPATDTLAARVFGAN